MSRGKNRPKEVNVPWITEDGFLDLTKLPIDSTLVQGLSENQYEFDSACRVLASMFSAGRNEAGIYLYGLMKLYQDNKARKGAIVEALGRVHTCQAADLLFSELNRTKSSNTTRDYINKILKALQAFPLKLVEAGFERLMSDDKWTYRMKSKFREVFEEIEYRHWRLTRKSS